MIDRRSALQGFGALAASLAVPASAATPSSGKPPRLRQGDTVGLVEPASFTDNPVDMEFVTNTIRGMGLVPKVAPHAMARYGYLAGTDEQRAADLNAMFADQDVRAVFAVRGGWGCARLLPFLDWKTIRANPKLLIGFSDITALHLAFAANAGFPTIHGPNAANNWPEISWNSLWALAFQGGTPTLGNPQTQSADLAEQERWRTAAIRPGKASGRLLGGNLTILSTLLGTPYVPDFTGALLFIEDTGEAEYRVDRMLTQLALAGVLRKVAGVIFGQCTDCTSDLADYSGFTVPQLLVQHLQPLGVPVFAGANIGHVYNQLCIPVRVKAEMDADAGTIRILEPAVA